jgi:hypothetical protein
VTATIVGRRCGWRARSARQRVTVHAWHADVQQHNRGVALAEGLDRRGAVVRQRDFRAERFQRDPQARGRIALSAMTSPCSGGESAGRRLRGRLARGARPRQAYGEPGAEPGSVAAGPSIVPPCMPTGRFWSVSPMPGPDWEWNTPRPS